MITVLLSLLLALVDPNWDQLKLAGAYGTNAYPKVGFDENGGRAYLDGKCLDGKLRDSQGWNKIYVSTDDQKWTGLKFPGFVDVYSFDYIVDINDPDHIAVAAFLSEQDWYNWDLTLLTTSNGGQTWETCEDCLDSLSISKKEGMEFLTDLTIPNRIYLNWQAYSDDFGQTWIMLNLPTQFPKGSWSIGKGVLVTFYEKYQWIGTCNYLTKQQKTYYHPFGDDKKIIKVMADPYIENKVYCSVLNGELIEFYTSYDLCQTWQKLATPIFTDFYIHELKSNYVWLYNRDNGQFYVSKNFGEGFELAVGAKIPAGEYITKFSLNPYDKDGFSITVGSPPKTPSYLTYFYLISPQNNSWTTQFWNEGLNNFWPQIVNQFIGLPNNELQQICLLGDSYSPQFIITEDNWKTWHIMRDPPDYDIGEHDGSMTQSSFNPSTLWLVTDKRLLFSSDFGAKWNEINDPRYHEKIIVQSIFFESLLNSDNYYLKSIYNDSACISCGDFFRSEDGGQNWEELPFDVDWQGRVTQWDLGYDTQLFWFSEERAQPEISFSNQSTNQNMTYFYGFRGCESPVCSKSSDQGKTWEPWQFNDEWKVGLIYEIRKGYDSTFWGIGRFEDSYEGYCMVKSTDLGLSWKNKTNYVINHYVLWSSDQLVLDPSNKDIVYANTTKGLVVSDDNGGNWKLIHFPINDEKQVFGRLMVTRNDERKVIICTENDGLFSLRKGYMGIADEQPILNLKVFPNPFKSKLTISADDLLKKVSVFDINGRLITHLKEQANNLYQWDGRDNAGSLIPNGVYLIKIETSHNSGSSNKVVWMGN
jgi:hypothetical protein